MRKLLEELSLRKYSSRALPARAMNSDNAGVGIRMVVRFFLENFDEMVEPRPAVIIEAWIEQVD